MQYPATELVLDKNGHVYHLGLSIENVAENVILVGDQDRVDLVASFFDSVEHSSQHREFVCKTGMYKGKRITALSTGIGTDNIDITINELDALYNIDTVKRIDKEDFTSLNLIRIGTCGILHPEIPIHSFILSTHAYGLDNVAHFYEIEFNESEKALNKKISDHIGLPEGVHTYTSEASRGLFKKLSSDKTKEGITVTSSGFYGPQGRQLRLKNRTSELNEKLTSFKTDEHRITNFEMESSALFSLGKALGHECATICLGIANRPNKEFSSGYNDDMLELIEYVLKRI
ncbi:MAG: nucleoside phosphorylase [Crocinitomicaceae bacterium]|nr:nucleoside phosphorylase [Crocinitomicaceae bacterium]